MFSKKVRNFLLYYIIISFTCILYLFVNEKSQYIPMLGVMYAAPFLYAISLFDKNQTHGLKMIWALIGFMCLSALYNMQNFRTSTFLYSLMFIFTFLLYTRILKPTEDLFYKLVKLIRWIVFLYSIVLILQQVSVLIGLEMVFNRCWIFPENRFKLNSLAIEPSNIGVILPLLMFTYIKLQEMMLHKKYDFKEIKYDWKIWISYSYTMLTCGSMSSVLAYAIMLLYFASLRNIFRVGIFAILTLVAVAYFDASIIERIKSLFDVTTTLDVTNIHEVDSSSSARVSPFIIYFSEFDPLNMHTWFGYGCDYGYTHLTLMLLGYLPEGNQGIGGFINYIYDYGMIAGILVLILIMELTKKTGFFFLFLFLTLVTVIPFNHYIFWLYFILLYTVRRFEDIKINHVATNYSRAFNSKYISYK